MRNSVLLFCLLLNSISARASDTSCQSLVSAPAAQNSTSILTGTAYLHQNGASGVSGHRNIQMRVEVNHRETSVYIKVSLDFLSQNGFPPAPFISYDIPVPAIDALPTSSGESKEFHIPGDPLTRDTFIRIHLDQRIGTNAIYTITKRDYYLNKVEGIFALIKRTFVYPEVNFRDTIIKMESKMNLSEIEHVELEDFWKSGKYISRFECGDSEIGETILLASAFTVK